MDLPDVLGRRAAAAARPGARRAARSGGRTTPCIPATTDRCCGPRCRAGRPAFGCADSAFGRDPRHPLDRFEHRRGPDAAVDADDVARARSSSGTNCSGGVPSRLLPSSSVVICATIGHVAHARAPPRSRRRVSLRSRNVSRMNRSTPPSSSAAACSRKSASASSTPVLPHGSMRMPSGPIAPATYA